MPYTRPPLSKDLLAGVDEPTRATSRPTSLDVTWRLGERGDRARRRRPRSRSGGGRRVRPGHPRHRQPRAPWTGARPGRTCTRCATSTTRSRCKTRSNAKPERRDRRRRLHRLRGRLGARKLGLESRSIDIAPLPSRRSAETIGAPCADMHREHGVDLGSARASRRSATAASRRRRNGTRIEAQVVSSPSARSPTPSGSKARASRSSPACCATGRCRPSAPRTSSPPATSPRGRTRSRRTRRPGSSTGPTRPSRARSPAATRSIRPSASAHERPDVLVRSVRREDPGRRPAGARRASTGRSESSPTSPSASATASSPRTLQRRAALRLPQARRRAAGRRRPAAAADEKLERRGHEARARRPARSVGPPGILGEWLDSAASRWRHRADENGARGRTRATTVVAASAAASARPTTSPPVKSEIELVTGDRARCPRARPVLRRPDARPRPRRQRSGRPGRPSSAGARSTPTSRTAIPAGPWLTWHCQRFTPPPGATRCSHARTGTQAFRHGPHLGVQFHPESTIEIVAGWAQRGRAH